MFYKFRRMILGKFHVKNGLYRVIAYCIAAFLILQCYGMSRAFEEDEYLEEIATIGDATYTSAVPGTDELLTEDPEELSFETEMVESAVSESYRVNPDTSNAFVSYAMSVERGSGIYTDNQCAIYVSDVLYGYYGEKAPVQSKTLVSQISNILDASEHWERVFEDADCFPKEKTEAEYDEIFDSLTNAGDVVCFVNKSLDNYVHCSIAGGGNALIGHLFSSGWDSLRACYYIDNAVDTRKNCSGMIVYRYKDKEDMDTGTIRVCKSYDEAVYRNNPKAYDIGGACYAVYLNRMDAENGQNAKGFCYIEPGNDGALSEDNVSDRARTKPGGEGDVVQFEPGTVYVREYWTPSGNCWKMDNNIYETTIKAGKRTTLGLARDACANPLILPETNEYFDTQMIGPEEPVLCKIGLSKKVNDNFAGVIGGNPNYDYSGIEYSIYRVDGNHVMNISDLAGVFTMDEHGNGKVTKCNRSPECIGEQYMYLPFGWYMIQETKANQSMTLDTTPKWIELTHENIEVLNMTVYDTPWVTKASLLLRKFGVNGEAVPGATYTISYYKESMETNPELDGLNPERTWVFQTDEKGEIRYSDNSAWFVEGDTFYRNENGEIIIPAGTLTFKEKTAPKGYIVDDTVYVKNIVPGDDVALSVENAVTVIEKNEVNPVIQTKAWYDRSLLDMEQMEQTITVVDTVFCQNLEPGHVYRISGEPHLKQDGSILVQNGNAVSGYTQFTADREEMEVEVYFEITVTRDLLGKQLVFFETLTDMSCPDEVVAEHKDLEDQNQTIDIPEEKATPTEPEKPETEKPEVKGESAVKTGDNSKVFVVLLIASTSAIGVVFMMLLKKKRETRR